MKRLLGWMITLSVLFMFASATFAADPTTVNGWVADSKCGVKAAHAGAAECTKKCLAAGAKMVVVTDRDQKVLTVDNPKVLEGHEGHHVAVTGTVNGDSIHVDKVKML
jgi:hypothetical protein